MPRPRILGSSWAKNRRTSCEKNSQLFETSARDRVPAEANCNVGVIDEMKEEPSEVLSGSTPRETCGHQPALTIKGVQLVKQCPMKLQETFQVSPSKTVVAPVSSTLALSFVPDASMGMANHARNLFTNQSMVMVLPVNTKSSQVFNVPTLCTLERIDNDNEITRLKEIVSTEDNGSDQRSASSALSASCMVAIPGNISRHFADEHERGSQSNFANDTTAEPPDTIARSLTSSNKRKITEVQRPLCNETGALSSSTEAFVNNTYPESVKKSRSLSAVSSLTISSMDIHECFDLESDEPHTMTTHSAVDRSSCNSALREASISSSEYQQDASSELSVQTSSDCPSRERTSSSRYDDKKRESKRIEDVTISVESNKGVNSPSVKIVGRSASFTGDEQAEDSMSVEEFRSMQPEDSGNDRFSESEIISIPAPQERTDEVESSTSGKRPIPPLRKLYVEVTPLESMSYSIGANQPKKLIEKKNSTDDRPTSPATLQNTETSRPEYQLPSKPDKIEKNSAKKHSSGRKLAPNCESDRADPWKGQCIVCKKRISGRNELHRHYTISHPDVQIVFCEICSDSFSTDQDLEEHRFMHCTSEDSRFKEIIDSFRMEDETETLPVRSETSKIAPKQKDQTPSRPRGRPRKKVVAPKDKSEDSSSSNFLGFDVTASTTENVTSFVNRCHVEEDAMKRNATWTKAGSGSAEMKQLIVPLTRLKSPVYEEYLKKLSARPITNFGVRETVKNEAIRGDEGNRKKSPGPSKKVGNRHRGRRKRRAWSRVKKTPSKKIGVKRPEVSSRGVLDKTLSKDKSNSNVDNDEDSLLIDSKKRRNIYTSGDTTDSDSSAIEFVSKTYSNENAVQTYSSDEMADMTKCIKSDSISKDQTIIGKLTPRLSAASFAAGKIKHTDCNPGMLRRHSDGRQKSVFSGAKDPIQIESSTERDSSPESGEHQDRADSSPGRVGRRSNGRQKRFYSPEKNRIRSSSSTERDSSLESEEHQYRRSSSRSGSSSRGDSPYIHGELDYEPTESDYDPTPEMNNECIMNGKMSLVRSPSISLESSKISRDSPMPPTKTYPPSRRCSESLEKLKRKGNSATLDAVNTDICSTCNALLTLMKQVTAEFESQSPRQSTVECPSCDLHFISMFHLEEHIAGDHLQCENKKPCCRAKNVSCLDAYLSCESAVTLTVECLQCYMKFGNEEEMNEHSIKDHNNQTPLKEISMTDSPNYLADLSCFCLHIDLNEDIGGASSKRYRNHDDENSKGTESDVRFSESQTEGDRAFSRITDEPKEASRVGSDSSKNVRVLQCWVCDLTFEKCSEYVVHMTGFHGISKRISEYEESSDIANNNPTAVIENEDSTFVPGIVDSVQDKKDREDLMKQLLSDDSMDGFEEVETSEIHAEPNDPSFVLVEEDGICGKRIVGHLAAAHTCKVCSKQFNRTQDLLMHRVFHNHNPCEPEPEHQESSRTGCVAQELFVDPPPTDAMNIGAFSVSDEKKRDAVESSHSPATKNSPGKDNIFVNNCAGKENRNFSVVHISNRSTTKAITDKNRVAKAEEYSTKPTNKKSSAPKKSRSKEPVSPSPEASRRCTEKRNMLEELLDTEKALASANETRMNAKEPIECGKCNRQFPNQATLNEHLFYLHDDSLKNTVLIDVLGTNDNEKRPWHCRGCGQNFKMLQGYSSHRYRFHADDSLVHVCENCYKVLTTVTMVNVHICIDASSYHCRACDETFPTGMSLRLHNMDKHMENDEPNLCEPCGKNFLTKSMLRRHEDSGHHFVRPYRPRRGSPVLMATGDRMTTIDDKTADSSIESYDEFSPFHSGDEEETNDQGCEEEASPSRKRKRRAPTSPEVTGLSRKRGFPGDGSWNVDRGEQDSQALGEDELALESDNTTTYIDQNKIHECSLCHLQCLTTATLVAHRAKHHAESKKLCQLCRNFYRDGKLLRHMMDEHIDPCETCTIDSTRSIEKNRDEKDVEAFIRIMGAKRFMCLWEYHRYNDSTDDSSFNCSACEMVFPSNSEYKLHYFTCHDAICVLCNIEFKSGEDAARHKEEEHRSSACYMWFVDRTLREVTASRNIHKAVEHSILDMISQERIKHHDNEDTAGDDTPAEAANSCSREDLEDYDENTILLSDTEREQEEDEQNEQKFMVVVTDEDLEKYNIGTRYPDIWGLATQISSTCEKFTPTVVKKMLESYFEN